MHFNIYIYNNSFYNNVYHFESDAAHVAINRKATYSFSLKERKQYADSKLKTAFVIMLIIKKLKINYIL